MGDQITELMHRAALDEKIRPQAGKRLLKPWRAVDDCQLRLLDPAFDQVIIVR